MQHCTILIKHSHPLVLFLHDTFLSLKLYIHRTTLCVRNVLDGKIIKRGKRAHLQHLADNLGGLAVRLQQALALLALLLDAVVLVQQLLEERLLVQLADEAVLDDVLAVVNEEVHDGLGDLIGNRLAHNVKVGRDERANQLRFHGLAVGQGGFVRFALLI